MLTASHGERDAGRTTRVVFWNRTWNGGRDRQTPFLAALDFDVLVLAEVTASTLPHFERALHLDAAGFTLAHVDVPDRRHPHGLVVFVRPPFVLEAFTPFWCDHPDLACRAERGFHAMVARGDQHFTLVGWHAPYAAGRTAEEKWRNPRAKRHGYQHLVDRLERLDEPLVLAMDGNNWGDWIDPVPVADADDHWIDERRFHGPDPGHGLVDTLRTAITADPDRRARVKGGEPLAVTKSTPRAGNHRMDRIYVSECLQVIDAGVLDTPAGTPTRPYCGSDHAPVWATLRG